MFGDKQEDTVLAQGEPPGGVGHGGLAWPPSSPDYSLSDYLVSGVSGL